MNFIIWRYEDGPIRVEEKNVISKNIPIDGSPPKAGVAISKRLLRYRSQLQKGQSRSTPTIAKTPLRLRRHTFKERRTKLTA
jgi:hypothetical protein